VRDTDTVARLGGDEFAVLMNSPCSREAADRLASRLVQGLARRFEVERHDIKIGGSIGISLAHYDDPPADPLYATTLLRQADLALYRAKRDGRNGHCFFDASMDEASLSACA
jgi:diguanylate cyclase (GGDEF)-like protein